MPPETVIHLYGESASRFIALLRNPAFEHLGAPPHVEPPDLVPSGVAVAAAYMADPSYVRSLIANDSNAEDVVAIARRRVVVREMRRMLEDDDYFDMLKEEHPAKSTEGVWQSFFEENPWVLGFNLATQALIAWDSARLEQVVAGFDISSPGKRADAVMHTTGLVSMLTLVEIKHHRTPLLKEHYRSGAWAPSPELVGAVAQSQTTVQLAIERIGTKLERHDAEGYDVPNDSTYLYRPRSYVIAGSLSEFRSENGGDHGAKIRSFELYRRNIHEPEIVTFDEILARGEMIVHNSGADPAETTQP